MRTPTSSAVFGGVLDDGDAVLLRQREHAQDLPDAVRRPVRVEMAAEAPIDGPAVVARPSSASVVGGVRVG